jgi:propanol-preferring alcohol dehydrogenase
VLCRKTIRGSIVNTRADLGEALQFAGEGKLAAHYATASLVEVNDILQRFQERRIEGRVVMTM